MTSASAPPGPVPPPAPSVGLPLLAVPPTVVALVGMDGFRCLGESCEDTCCQHWTISIDAPHLDALLARSDATPEEHAVLAAAFELRPPGERTPSAHARIRLRADDGHCPLLTPSRLCSVHARFGEAALPDVCASYPRLGRVVGDRFELHGALSCPEVARRTLLVDGGADLTELGAGDLGRVPLLDRHDGSDAALLDGMRGALLLLLDDARFPLSSRLFFLAWFAEEARAATEDVATGDVGGQVAAVEEALELVTTPDVLDALDEEARHTPPSDGAAELLLSQVARLRSALRPTFAVALDPLLDAAVAAGALRRTDGGGLARGDAPRARTWLATIGADARTWSPAPAPLLDAWLGRLARAHLLRAVVSAPAGEVVTLVRELVLRIATLRVLVPALAATPGGAPDEATLAATFVRCVYQTARLLDHGGATLAALHAGAEQALGSPFEHAALLSLAFSPGDAAPDDPPGPDPAL